jgi:hypothetical protein
MVTPDLVLQGQVRWFDFGAAVGSEPQGHRPVVVIQGDEIVQAMDRDDGAPGVGLLQGICN